MIFPLPTCQRACWLGQIAAVGGVLLMLGGCAGEQSALDPAGRGAEQIAALFWWMLGGAVVIWCIVVGLAIYAIRIAPGPHDDRQMRLWVIGGGAVIPTLVLTVLLIYGLSMLPGLVRAAPEGSLQVDVVGLQWWWQVRYPASESVKLANEIRIPVGEPVQFNLTSADVIHSFWIPALGGKVDMVPGREGQAVADPYYGGAEGFAQTWADVNAAAKTLVARFS